VALGLALVGVSGGPARAQFEGSYKGFPVPTGEALVRADWMTPAQLRYLRSIPSGRAYLRHILRPLPPVLRKGLYLGRPVRVSASRAPRIYEPQGGHSPLLLVLLLGLVAATSAYLAVARFRPGNSARGAKAGR
jgi:hypothetical protein